MTKRLLCFFVTITVLLGGGATRASETVDGDSAAHRFAAGIKASFMANVGHGETVEQFGGGPFVEWVALPGWIELEASFKVLGSAHGVSLPIELLVKYPIHVHHAVHLYVGVGPVVVPVFGEDDSSVHAGLTSAVGAYISLSHRWAALAEVAYELLREHGMTVHELGCNAGVVYRF